MAWLQARPCASSARAINTAFAPPPAPDRDAPAAMKVFLALEGRLSGANRRAAGRRVGGQEHPRIASVRWRMICSALDRHSRRSTTAADRRSHCDRKFRTVASTRTSPLPIHGGEANQVGPATASASPFLTPAPPRRPTTGCGPVSATGAPSVPDAHRGSARACSAALQQIRDLRLPAPSSRTQPASASSSRPKSFPGIESLRSMKASSSEAKAFSLVRRGRNSTSRRWRHSREVGSGLGTGLAMVTGSLLGCKCRCASRDRGPRWRA